MRGGRGVELGGVCMDEIGEGRRRVWWEGFVAVHSEGVRKLPGEYEGECNEGEVL